MRDGSLYAVFNFSALSSGEIELRTPWTAPRLFVARVRRCCDIRHVFVPPVDINRTSRQFLYSHHGCHQIYIEREEEGERERGEVREKLFRLLSPEILFFDVYFELIYLDANLFTSPSLAAEFYDTRVTRVYRARESTKALSRGTEDFQSEAEQIYSKVLKRLMRDSGGQ